jgi:dTDP-4-dehydrorhamnose reductase
VKVLITGAGGQLGQDLVDTCRRAGDDVIAADHGALDVGERDQVLGAVTTLQPEGIVHAGAWTAVDACESDPARAFRANALGCRHVAEGARRVGAALVAVSTDYVFDGAKAGAYHEWDRTNPQSVYGASKLAGEQEVLHGCPGAAVVRTSWLCGAHGPNVVKTVLRLARDPDRRLGFVDDQRGSPTFTADLAPLLRRLVVARLPGVFHATNTGETTWFGFVQAVLRAAGHDPERVKAITTAELDPPRPAPRPANSVLANAALAALGWEPLPHFEESLVRLVKEL